MAEDDQRRHLLARYQQADSANSGQGYAAQAEPTGQTTAQVRLTSPVLGHSKTYLSEGTDLWLRRMVRLTGSVLVLVGIILAASETGLLAKLTQPNRPASSGLVRASQSGQGTGARPIKNGTSIAPTATTPTTTNPRVTTFGPAVPATLGGGSAAPTSTTSPTTTSSIPPTSTTTRPTTTSTTSTTTTTSSSTTTTTAPSGTGNPPRGGGG